VAKSRERKRRKVDVIEHALKRFHEEESKPSRRVEFTTMCRPRAGDRSPRNRRREAAKVRVQVGVSLAQGARPYMEDRYSVVERLLEDEDDAESSPSLLAVYDGHNGAYASEYARRRFKDLLGENEDLIEISRRALHAELTADDVEKIRELLVDAFATVDAEILQRTVILNKRDGSTVLLGLLVGGKLFVANLGDSRGVLAQAEDSAEDSDGEEDEELASTAVRLSVDHKPDLREETERVEEAGGKVIFSGCWRVAHDQIPLRLAISRSLGDHPLKTNLPASCSAPLVSVVPDVRVLDVEAAGEFLVFASDGLWDRLSDDDAAKIVRAKVAEYHWSEQPTSTEDVTKESLQFAANALVEAALLKRSMDNITAMVVSFSELSEESTDA
jgi:serine/threonine protein phosphatase PrpC